MEKEVRQAIDDEIVEMSRLLIAKIDNLHNAMNKRFETLKKVIGDYLDLSSNLSIASVKANLKNV